MVEVGMGQDDGVEIGHGPETGQIGQAVALIPLRHPDTAVDGHAPGLSGGELDKYAAAGITTDHECVAIGEALEKIARGMKIQIREGSGRHF